MVGRIKKHAAILSLLIVFGIPFVLVPGFAGMFIKFDGIDGEAVDKGHEDWIELDSMQFGVGRTISQTGGGDRETSNPSFSELTLTKEMDKSSPLLFFEAIAGSSLGKATLELTQTGTEGSQTYLKLELEEAIVSSYSTSSEGERPAETFALNFTKIAYTYTQYDDSGKEVGSTTKQWDLMANKEY